MAELYQWDRTVHMSRGLQASSVWNSSRLRQPLAEREISPWHHPHPHPPTTDSPTPSSYDDPETPDHSIQTRKVMQSLNFYLSVCGIDCNSLLDECNQWVVSFMPTCQHVIGYSVPRLTLMTTYVCLKLRIKQYTVSTKRCHFVISCNFVKCPPISTIFSPPKSTCHFQQNTYDTSHYTLSMLLHYLGNLGIYIC